MVVLGGVDAALRGDRVGAAGAVVQAERFTLVTQLRQRGCCGRAGQPGANDDNFEFAAVGGVDQFAGKPVIVPFFRQGSGWSVRIEFHGSTFFLQ